MSQLTWGQAKKSKEKMKEFSSLRAQNIPVWPLELHRGLLTTWIPRRVKEVGRTETFKDFKNLAKNGKSLRDTQCYPSHYDELVSGVIFPEKLEYRDDISFKGIVEAVKFGYHGVNLVDDGDDGIEIEEFGTTIELERDWEASLRSSRDDSAVMELDVEIDDMRVERRGANQPVKYEVRESAGRVTTMKIAPNLQIELGVYKPADEVVLALFDYHVRVLFEPLFLAKNVQGIEAIPGMPECRTPRAIRASLEKLGFTTIRKGLLEGPAGKLSISGLKLEGNIVTVKTAKKPTTHALNNALVISQVLGRDLK